MMRLEWFLADGFSTLHVSQACTTSLSPKLHLNGLSVRITVRYIAWAQRTPMQRKCSSGQCSHLWSVLSIRSRWNRPAQMTNLEVITKVVDGLYSIPSPTLHFPFSGDSCYHLSVSGESSTTEQHTHSMIINFVFT